jgi:Membrane-fusion protein
MKKHLIAAAFAGAFLTLAGCADESTPPSAQAQFLQPIDVANVLVKPVQSWHTYTTRLESPQEVALMPRVSGVIEQITFNEGDLVKKAMYYLSLMTVRLRRLLLV